MIQFTFSKPCVLNYSKWVLFLVIVFLIQHTSSAQNRIASQLNQARATTVSKKYTLFSSPLSSARLAADTVFVPGATVYRFSLNKETAILIESRSTPLLELSIPISATQSIDLELIPHIIFAPTFKVTNARGETIAPQALGSYYHGIIKGDPQSSASISIINGEISGIISNKDGNYNLGKEPKTTNYLFYNDKDLKQKPDFTCATPDAPVKAMGQNLIKTEASLTNVACGSVEIYFEADNALYQAQGSSIPNTVSYINALFSNVATLYSNEGLSAVISEIKVWDTTDPYAGAASSGDALTAFRNNVGTGFNGRLAHLLSGRGLGGGVAYLDVLCEKSYAHGVSGNLSSTITNLPNYSWNVEVVTHELGHNFGSPHTQSCSWPGGALDNCYTTEGGCAPGPAPTNGGTIMSYCHLTGYGINFANGFGTLPGNLIRNLAQVCLGSAAPPTNLTTLELYDTQALVSWTHDAGTYTVEYRPTSSSSWIVAGTTGAKNKFLTSLSPNTAYEWRVKVNCSDYAVGTFTTNSTTAPPLYCTTTHTNGCTYGIVMTGVQLGGTTLSSASGCVSGGYNFITSPIKDLSLGQSVNFTINLEGYYNDSQLAIWIDLNKDHVFQTNEKVYTTGAAITQALTGSFTVPFGSSLGKTRMRIVLDFSAYTSTQKVPSDPCGTYGYGETEDYYVNLICVPFTQFTVTGGGNFCVGGSGVAVGLSGSQTGVNYQLKRNGTNTGAAIAGTGSALSFGLQNTAGTYTVEASTANCPATFMTGSPTVTVSAVPTLVAGLPTNPTTCGGTNGSIAFTTTNFSNGTYSLSFTGAGSPKTVTITSNTLTLSGLSAGAYSNFSIVNNGCTANDPTVKTLTDPAVPALVAGTATNPTTCGGTNGSITFATTNLPDGTYSLSFTGTGSPKSITVTANAFTLSGLAAGAYSNFSITNNNCTGTDATIKTLINPPTPTLLAGTATNPTTCGGTNGSIAFATTNLANGTYSLSFTGTGSPKSITVAANAFTLNGLAAGTYSNFSIINNGCTGTDATIKTLTNPPTPTLAAGTATNPTTCAGTNGNIVFATTNLPDGAYSLSFTGTGSPKSINVAANTFTLSGLSTGAYSNFSITNNGCIATDNSTKTLTAPLSPTLLAGVTTNPTTCAGTNGSIVFATTNLSDGNYSLAFTGTGSPKQITVSANAFTLTGLAAGVYSNFSITNNGCTGTDATVKTLTNPPTPTLVAGTVANPTTCGGTNGSIAFTATNLPNGSYTLTYTGTGSPKTITVSANAFTLSGLAAGTYSNFSITNNNCTASDPIVKTLTDPSAPNAGSISGTLSVCTGSTTPLTSNGVSGGIWSSSNPSVVTINTGSGIATGVSRGNSTITYAITVNGCTGSTTAVLTVDSVSVGGSISGSTAVCSGTNNTLLTLAGHFGSIQKWQSALSPDFSAATDIANTTTSLTAANLTQTAYYRAVLQNGVCTPANSSSATVSVNSIPAVSITGPTAISVGSTTTLSPASGGTWQSNSISKATVTNAGVVTGIGAGTAAFTFTQTATGCSNTTLSVTIISNGSPCDQAITLSSPADDYNNGSVLKQTNLTINAANKITGTATTVTYQAGSSITLSPGFQAEAGTVFKTQIVGCN
jgi:hypothetical protein